MLACLQEMKDFLNNLKETQIQQKIITARYELKRIREAFYSLNSNQRKQLQVILKNEKLYNSPVDGKLIKNSKCY